MELFTDEILKLKGIPGKQYSNASWSQKQNKDPDEQRKRKIRTETEKIDSDTAENMPETKGWFQLNYFIILSV